MILQLDPALPFWHVRTQQPCEAFLVLDYGRDADLIFVCIMRNGEIWSCPSHWLRGVENHTIGRKRSEPPDDAGYRDKGFNGG